MRGNSCVPAGAVKIKLSVAEGGNSSIYSFWWLISRVLYSHQECSFKCTPALFALHVEWVCRSRLVPTGVWFALHLFGKQAHPSGAISLHPDRPSFHWKTLWQSVPIASDFGQTVFFFFFFTNAWRWWKSFIKLILLNTNCFLCSSTAEERSTDLKER